MPYLSNVTITCKDAKFDLKPSEAERFYTNLFYEYFTDSLQTLQQLKQRGIILAGGVHDFAESVTFKPRENTEELVPIFPMSEIWTRLYVNDFFDTYNRDRPKLANLLQAKQGVLSKDDVKLVEQLVTPQKDYRAFASKNMEDIIEVSVKLGREPWEAGFKRDGGEMIRARIDSLMKQGTPEIIWSFMPVTQGDVSALTEFVNRMLSTHQIVA